MNSRFSSPVSLAKMIPALTLSVACTAFLTSSYAAETGNLTNGNAPKNLTPAASSTDGKPAISPAAPVDETVSIEPPGVSAVHITSLQFEPGSGNLALQTNGSFLAPSLDTSNWPNRLVITLADTLLDADFVNAPDAFLAALKEEIPQATAVQIEQTNVIGTQIPAIKIILSFQELPANAPKPQVLVNTGTLLAVGLKPYEATTTNKHVAKSGNPVVGLSVTQAGLPANLGGLYAYFSTVDASTESNSRIDGLVFHAWKEFLAGNSGNAILTLRPYVERVPDDQAARYLLAASYVHSGELSGADKEFTTLLLQHQDSLPLVLSLLQVKLLAPGDTVRDDKTITPLLQQALKKWPSHAALSYYQAKYTLASGSLSEARQAILKALTLDPKAEYYELLGDIELRGGNQLAAKTAYLDGLSFDPSEQSNRLKLAMMESQEQQPEVAMKQYEKVLAPDWLLNYAELLQQNKHKDQALAVLKLADLAVGDARNYNMMDKIKPVVYELGMRFAEFNEMADSQRNLKLFVELSNIKPDSDSSDNAKRLPIAKEMLQRIATMPSTASKVASSHNNLANQKTQKRTVVTTAAAKEQPVKPVVEKKPSEKRIAEKKLEKSPAEKAPIQEAQTAEAKQSAPKAEDTVSKEFQHAKAVAEKHEKKHTAKQDAEGIEPVKFTPSYNPVKPETSEAKSTSKELEKKHQKQELKEAPKKEEAKQSVPPEVKSPNIGEVKPAEPKAVSKTEKPQQSKPAVKPTATNDELPAAVMVHVQSNPEAGQSTDQSKNTKPTVKLLGAPPDTTTAKPSPALERNMNQSSSTPEAKPVPAVANEATPQQTEKKTSEVKVSNPAPVINPAPSVPVTQPVAPSSTIVPASTSTSPTIQTAPVSATTNPPQVSSPAATVSTPSTTAAEKPADKPTVPASEQLSPLPGAKQIERIPSPYYPQSATFE